MKRDDVVKAIEDKLGELAVPAHVRNVQKIPSKVEVSVLAGGGAITIVARSGITRTELDDKLRELENAWCSRTGTVDIEEVAMEAAE